jgi:hypothetical protein
MRVVLVLRMQYGVSVGECPATHILPRHANWITFGKKRRVGHVFRETPIDLQRTRRHFIAIFDEFFDLALDCKALRNLPHTLRLARANRDSATVVSHSMSQLWPINGFQSTKRPVFGSMTELRHHGLAPIKRLSITLH